MEWACVSELALSHPLPHSNSAAVSCKAHCYDHSMLEKNERSPVCFKYTPLFFFCLCASHLQTVHAQKLSIILVDLTYQRQLFDWSGVCSALAKSQIHSSSYLSDDKKNTTSFLFKLFLLNTQLSKQMFIEKFG